MPGAENICPHINIALERARDTVNRDESVSRTRKSLEENMRHAAAYRDWACGCVVFHKNVCLRDEELLSLDDVEAGGLRA